MVTAYTDQDISLCTIFTGNADDHSWSRISIGIAKGAAAVPISSFTKTYLFEKLLSLHPALDFLEKSRISESIRKKFYQLFGQPMRVHRVTGRPEAEMH
jgi:hypothetical protein